MDYEELSSLSKRRMTLSFSVPMRLVEVVDRITAAEGARSAAVVLERLLRKGLAVERNEREARAKNGE